MVQVLLRANLRRASRPGLALAGVCLLAPALLAPALLAAPKSKNPPPGPEQWEMTLDGGRKLLWENSFQSEREVRPNRGFWNKVVDFIAGEPDFRQLVRPYSVITDSHGRIIVSDPGAQGVHVFDFQQKKYKFLEHEGSNPMLTPQCVAVDAQDNIYVTDSQSGDIFVFASTGKFQRTIGAIKGGEGYYKRPTGIAVDSANQRIYVTDTLRNKVFILDMQGDVLSSFGKPGNGDGEFNLPTELRLQGKSLIVVDAMNFRLQSFDTAGNFQFAVGKVGDSPGAIFRPKAVSVDSEGHFYIVDAEWGLVQVLDQKGQLVYYFGEKGTHAGQFQLPAGLFIDQNDRIYVVDSYNHRVQIFHYFGLKQPPVGGMQ